MCGLSELFFATLDEADYRQKGNLESSLPDHEEHTRHRARGHHRDEFDHDGHQCGEAEHKSNEGGNQERELHLFVLDGKGHEGAQVNDSVMPSSNVCNREQGSNVRKWPISDIDQGLRST